MSQDVPRKGLAQKCTSRPTAVRVGLPAGVPVRRRIALIVILVAMSTLLFALWSFANWSSIRPVSPVPKRKTFKKVHALVDDGVKWDPGSLIDTAELTPEFPSCGSDLYRSKLRPGEKLFSEKGPHFVCSPNGHVRFGYDRDGDLSLWHRDRKVWSAETKGIVTYTVMQEDGNLVAYSNVAPHWSADSGGNPGATLTVDDDGQARIWLGNDIIWVRPAIPATSDETCNFQEWQKRNHPTCNDIHALSMADMLLHDQNMLEIIGHGGASVISKLTDVTTIKNDKSAAAFIGYKTPQFYIDYDANHFEAHRRDVVAMDMLGDTTLDIYRYCGMSSLMEFGIGGTLHDKLVRAHQKDNKQVLTPLKKLEYALNVSRAVEKVHSLDEDKGYVTIFHNDLMPANIILDAHDKVKLIDFHQSIFIPSDGKGSPCSEKRGWVNLTSNIGFDMFAPEWIAGEILDEKVDVYRLGVIFFIFLTNHLPYHCNEPPGVCGKTEPSLIKKIRLENEEALPMLPIDIEKSTDPATIAIREAMKRAMQKDPRRRPSAREIAVGLERASTFIQSTSQRCTSNCASVKGQGQNVTEPFYIAAYPGSGSELTMNIIESLTGIRTVGYGGRCEPPETPYDYIALKTHYPWNCDDSRWEHGLLSNAMILIRNPIDSLPSRANREYEKAQKLRGHSTQAPEEHWVSWRDKNFDKNLEVWEELINYWHSRYSEDKKLFVLYEHLVNENSGPQVMREIAQFVGNIEGVRVPTKEEEICCVWQKVVNGDSSQRRSGIKRLKSYQPKYTPSQYGSLKAVFSRLKREYHNESFGSIFEEYETSLEGHMPNHSYGSDKRNPEIAWLVSWPNSYNTQIRTLIQVTTHTSGATNYGNERITLSGDHIFNASNLPVYAGEQNGPFRISEDLPLPDQGFVLTKTHCGINGCYGCNVVPTEDFFNNCRSGISGLTANGKPFPVMYDADNVKRVVHLVLNPITNVVSRFKSDKGKRNGDFRAWCEGYDERYVMNSSRSELIPLSVLQSNVLCHSELFKYVQWHNNVLEVARTRGLNVHRIFAEDFQEATYEKTLKSLLQFLNLDMIEKGKPFETIRFDTYIGASDVVNIIQFIGEHSSEELWKILRQRYFGGS